MPQKSVNWRAFIQYIAHEVMHEGSFGVRFAVGVANKLRKLAIESRVVKTIMITIRADKFKFTIQTAKISNELCLYAYTGYRPIMYNDTCISLHRAVVNHVYIALTIS